MLHAPSDSSSSSTSASPGGGPRRSGRVAVWMEVALWAAVATMILVVASSTLGGMAGRLTAVEPYRELAEHWGKEYGIDPDLILAVAAIESGGDPRARSPVGALGLMQLMPATADDCARRLKLGELETEDLFDPELNIRLGAFYLRWLADRFGDHRPRTILAGYNAGYGRVRDWLAEAPAIDADSERADRDLAARIDYPETSAYVTKVLDAWSTLRAKP